MYPGAAQHTPMHQGWEEGAGKGPEMSIYLISSLISRTGIMENGNVQNLDIPPKVLGGPPKILAAPRQCPNFGPVD